MQSIGRCFRMRRSTQINIPAFRGRFNTTLAQPLEPETPRKKLQFIDVLLSLIVVSVVMGQAYNSIDILNKPKKNILLEDQFTHVALKSITQINHDTFHYKLNVKSSPDLKGPWHLIVKDDSCQVARAYTPITVTENEIGLLIKQYPTGELSRMFAKLQVGEDLMVRGPISSMPTSYQRNSVAEIGMVAAGTGITPMYQLIKQILDDPKDKTKISLFYLNRTPEDVRHILKEKYPDRLSTTFSLNGYKGWDWTGARGLKLEDIKRTLPTPSDGIAVLVCGPDGFVEKVGGARIQSRDKFPPQIVGGMLKELGYTDQMVFKF